MGRRRRSSRSATRYEEEQDHFALVSHQTRRTRDRVGRFRDEITPVFLPPRYEETVADDVGFRPEQTLEALARLKPVSTAVRTVTAGNSSQITDGAAALVVASETRAREAGLSDPGDGSGPGRSPAATPPPWDGTRHTPPLWR